MNRFAQFHFPQPTRIKKSIIYVLAILSDVSRPRSKFHPKLLNSLLFTSVILLLLLELGVSSSHKKLSSFLNHVTWPIGLPKQVRAFFKALQGNRYDTRTFNTIWLRSNALAFPFPFNRTRVETNKRRKERKFRIWLSDGKSISWTSLRNIIHRGKYSVTTIWSID